MSIATGRPHSGLRVDLERDVATNTYRGAVLTPDSEWTLVARIDAAGAVTLETDAPSNVSEKVRLLVRTALRHAETEGSPLPRFIRRWRAA